MEVCIWTCLSVDCTVDSELTPALELAACIAAATDCCSAEVGDCAAKNDIIAGLICARGLVKYGDCNAAGE